jgi:hypothetical protein
MLSPEPVEIEGIGKGKRLTLVQMADLRFSIRSDLIALATHEVSGVEKGQAVSAIAVHVSGMSKLDQLKSVLASPMLKAEAAKMMVGGKLSLMEVAAKITPENEEEIHRAIAESYGFGFTAEGEQSGNPPKADSTTSGSAES